ncbi:MAG: DNA glycosylase [Lonepinella koalarum]|nr:DNA glycosylase [Lonepinella koalarum]
MAEQIEIHPFPPLLPSNARVMMMGTFPPTTDKRCMDFYYPNFQNDMWRIYGVVFFDDPTYFQVKNEKCFDPERIKYFLTEKGIALCPSATKAIREKGNASDKFLKIIEPINLSEILQQVPDVRWLLTTGGKATEVLFSLVDEKLIEPKTNQYIDFPYKDYDLKLYRVPSSSRAYPLSLQKKAEAYRQFFQLAGIL